MIHQPSLLGEKTRALIPILERAGLPFALLFGSAGRREPFRDLDVAIAGALELNQILQLGVALESAAGVPVDLVTLENAPTALQYEASKGLALTVKDPDQLASWKERIWNEYFAQAPFLHDYAREMLQARAENQ